MHNFKSYTIYKAVFSPTYGTAHAASILMNFDQNVAEK